MWIFSNLRHHFRSSFWRIIIVEITNIPVVYELIVSISIITASCIIQHNKCVTHKEALAYINNVKIINIVYIPERLVTQTKEIAIINNNKHYVLHYMCNVRGYQICWGRLISLTGKIRTAIKSIRFHRPAAITCKCVVLAERKYFLCLRCF